MAAIRSLRVSLMLLVSSLTWGAVLGQEEDGPLLLSPLIKQGLDYSEIRLRSLVRGIPGLNITSYSGFITANDSLGIHLFFWYIPSITNSDDAPLLAWCNGGPGLSSMKGLLLEHGPVQPRKMSNGNYETIPRDTHWAQEISVLYIDPIADVGYSFSTMGQAGQRAVTKDVALDLYAFLKQFFLLFPTRSLYVGGQSYAGKYSTALAYLIDQEKQAGRSSLPLKGIYLGGPFINAKVSLEHDIDFIHYLGAMSKNEANVFQNRLSDYVSQFNNGTFELGIGEAFNNLYPNNMNLVGYDNFVTGNYVDDKALQSVMSSSIVRRKVHVGSNQKFSFYNRDLFLKSFGQDLFVNYDNELGALLTNNYKVLVYTADYDIAVGNTGVEMMILNISWPLQNDYKKSKRQVWTIGSEDQPELRGYFSSVGHLCRVIVHEAGHQVPHDRPEAMFQLISEFVQQGCLQV